MLAQVSPIVYTFPKLVLEDFGYRLRGAIILRVVVAIRLSNPRIVKRDGFPNGNGYVDGIPGTIAEVPWLF
jgi:hypothetical protein